MSYQHAMSYPVQPMRLLFIWLITAAGGACTTQSEMASVDIPDAFIDPIDATVAVYYSDDLRDLELIVSDPKASLSHTHILPIGLVSIDMFNQAIGDTFAEVVTLDSLDSIESIGPKFVAVLIPRINNAEGMYWVPSPVLIPGQAIDLEISFTVDLVDLQGLTIATWTRGVSKHQDKKFGDFKHQIEVLLEELMREAGSAFIMDFPRSALLASSTDDEIDTIESSKY